MKCLQVYLWVFASAQVFLLSTVSCFSTVPNSAFGTENHGSVHKICAVTVFLWSYTVGCNSNSYRSSSTTEDPQEGRESAEVSSQREHKSKRSSLKSQSHNLSNHNLNVSLKTDHKIKGDRQRDSLTAATKLSNEEMIIEDLKEHLISKLGVLDPMMCLPKAICGLSSAATNYPNSSSQLVKDYLRHMKAIILPTITTTPRPHRVRVKTTLAPNISPEDFQEQAEQKGEENSQSDEKDYDKSQSEETQEDETQEEEEDEDYGDDSAEDDLPTDSDEELLRSYIHDKAEVEQYLKDEPYSDDDFWWKKVPQKEMEPINFNSGAGYFNTMFPNRLTSMFTSVLPSFKFDLSGSKKKKGVFEDDPFFSSFRSMGEGRSLTNENPTSEQFNSIFSTDFLNGRLISDKHKKKILKQVKKLAKKIKRRKQRRMRLETLKTKKKVTVTPKPASLKEILNKVLRKSKKMSAFPPKMVLSERIIDEQHLNGMHNELSEIPNPISRLQTAVNIGKKLDDPRKCDILFSACPWKHDQVLQIIEDSHVTVQTGSSNSGYNVMRKEKIKHVVTTKKPKVKGSPFTKPKQTSHKNNSFNNDRENNVIKHSSGTSLSKSSSTKNGVRNKNSATVINHKLPGGQSLEITLTPAKVNKKRQKPKDPIIVPKIHPAILAPFRSTSGLGVKTNTKKKNKNKNIAYQYPTYNYRVSFPENKDHKSAIIQQFMEMTKMAATERPKPLKPKRPSTTTTTTTTKRPAKKSKKKKKNSITENDINVLEDSSESIVIRIPKTKNQPTLTPPQTYNKNPFFFNPYKYFQQPFFSNYPTAVPTSPPQYYYPQQYHQQPQHHYPQQQQSQPHYPQQQPQYIQQPQQPQYIQQPQQAQYIQQPQQNPWYLFGRRNGKVRH